MNGMIALLKRMRLNQILMAFMAGVLLFVSTACSGGQLEAKTTGTRQQVPAGLETVPGKKNPRPEVPEEAVTNTFQKGTMNEFSDVDPRSKDIEADVSSKAKALKDNAERNVSDQKGDVGEKIKGSLDKQGENLQDFGKNIQDSTSDLTKGAKRTAEDVKDTVKANTPDADNLNRGVKRAAENVKDNTKAAGRDVVDKAQRAANNTPELVQDKANQAAQNTGNFVQDKVNKVVEAVNKAGKAADNALD